MLYKTLIIAALVADCNGVPFGNLLPVPLFHIFSYPLSLPARAFSFMINYLELEVIFRRG
jgi:hypothetical protein